MRRENHRKKRRTQTEMTREGHERQRAEPVHIVRPDAVVEPVEDEAPSGWLVTLPAGYTYELHTHTLYHNGKKST